MFSPIASSNVAVSGHFLTEHSTNEFCSNFKIGKGLTFLEYEEVEKDDSTNEEKNDQGDHRTNHYVPATKRNGVFKKHIRDSHSLEFRCCLSVFLVNAVKTNNKNGLSRFSDWWFKNELSPLAPPQTHCIMAADATFGSSADAFTWSPGEGGGGGGRGGAAAAPFLVSSSPDGILQGKISLN